MFGGIPLQRAERTQEDRIVGGLEEGVVSMSAPGVG